MNCFKNKSNLILILFLIIFSSCEEDIKNNNILNKSNSLDNIGVKHNEYIDHYLSNTNINFDNSKSLLNDYYSFSMRNNSELEEYDTLLNNHANEFNVNLNISDLYDYFKNELNELKSQNEISDFMHLHFMNILENPTLKNAREQINIIEKNEDLSENERQRLNAFVNVLNSSEVFWSSYTNKDNSFKSDPCPGIDASEAAIIGDAIGGALWWWTGAAAALIAGAYSLATYNGCP
mgnify:CR=1 FL=1